MKRKTIIDGIVRILGTALALAAFYGLFSAFVVMARDAGEPERREVVIDLPGAGAPVAEDAEFVTDINVGDIEIYREGDGPAPAWYRPDEAMAAEWSAEVKDAFDAGLESERNEKNEAFLLDVPMDAEFQAYLHGLCTEYGVPYTLAVAVIEAESTYRADVISDDGDYGLMQINWRCLSWLSDELGITDFLDARQNARAGVYILGLYYRQYGAESGTLMAYNMGQAAAEELFARGVYETDYSRRVISIRWRIENGGAE